MHVAARRVVRRPHARRLLGDGIEVPHLLAGLGIVGSHEAADAVFAAVSADEDLAVDGGGRHRLAVAELRVGDLRLPDEAARLRVERHQLCVERRHEDLVAVDGDAAIVRTAAVGRDRPHLVLVVPVLLAGLGVERVDVIEGRGDVHDAVDDDRSRLQRLLHLRLEDPSRMQLADVRRVDLLAGEVARLVVVAVGVQEVVRVVRSRAQLLLRDRRASVRSSRLSPYSARSPERSPRSCRSKAIAAPIHARTIASFVCFMASSSPARARTRPLESGSHGGPRRELWTLRLPLFPVNAGNLIHR